MLINLFGDSKIFLIFFGLILYMDLVIYGFYNL